MCIYVNWYIYVNENNLWGYKKQDTIEGERVLTSRGEKNETIMLSLRREQQNLGSQIECLAKSALFFRTAVILRFHWRPLWPAAVGSL